MYLLLTATPSMVGYTSWQTLGINKTIPECKDHFNILKFELPYNKSSLTSYTRLAACLYYRMAGNAAVNEQFDLK
jgi:hypothetical protein